tara:strand:+ start:238 stop:405 length:168 start_codon:yes stop_codon:yes gene_type:complete
MGISCRGLERQVFGNFNINQKKAPGVPVLLRLFEIKLQSLPLRVVIILYEEGAGH